MFKVGRLLVLMAIFGWCPTARVALGQDAKSTIRVHTSGPSILSLAFEIAKEEGFYRQESLNLELITMASGAGVQALVAGSVDAGFHRLADFAKEDLGPFIGGGVSVSDKFLKERPDLLGRVLRATWRAHRAIKTNRLLAVSSLGKFIKLPADLAEKI